MLLSRLGRLGVVDAASNTDEVKDDDDDDDNDEDGDGRQFSLSNDSLQQRQ